MSKRTKAILISNVVGPKSIFVVFAGLALIVTLVFCQRASSQDNAPQYKQLDLAPKYAVLLPPIDANTKESRKVSSQYKTQRSAINADRNTIRSALESNQSIPAQLLSEFMNGFVFPSMTQTDTRIISKLGEIRTKFIKNYLSSKVVGNARRNIIDITIKAMEPIYANKELHPAARLNAVYLIGQLDDVAHNRLGNQPPQPSKSAFASLMKIVSSNNDEETPDFVKVAALAGIQRHLEIERVAGLTIDPAAKQALITKMNEALQNQDDSELAYWLKRRFMQIAGLIGDPRTADSAINTIKSEDAGLWLQLDAVNTIGNLDLSAMGPAKKLEIAVAITDFLAQAFDSEANSIDASIDKLVFDNILLRNIDLISTGTNYKEDTPAATNGTTDANSGRSSGGSGGDGNKFGKGGGGIGGAGSPGEGAGGEGGQGGGRGSGIARMVIDPNALLELPNYQLDDVRRRIKSLAFIGIQVLGEDLEAPDASGLRVSLTAEGKDFVDKVVRQLNITLDDSSVGILERDPRGKTKEEDDGDAEPVTAKLKQICLDSRDALTGFIGGQNDEPDADANKPKDDGSQ